MTLRCRINVVSRKPGGSSQASRDSERQPTRTVTGRNSNVTNYGNVAADRMTDVKLPNAALALLAVPFATLLTGCDDFWPSAAVEGTPDSMTIHLVACSDRGIVELAVTDVDSRDLWRIQSDEPIAAWEIEYGVAPAGFEVLQQPQSLADVERVLIHTTFITGRGNEWLLQRTTTS